jgi:hypothetical protein
MKSISQALIDAVHYPISEGYIENVSIERGLNTEDNYSQEVSQSAAYKGALADCLYSLVQAVNFSEADKSVGNLTDEQRKLILRQANDLYEEIGEPVKDDGKPMVYIGG